MRKRQRASRRPDEEKGSPGGKFAHEIASIDRRPRGIFSFALRRNDISSLSSSRGLFLKSPSTPPELAASTSTTLCATLFAHRPHLATPRIRVQLRHRQTTYS
ncbi:hypothetical protein Cob_v009458 [Colletotrichum orbiculare MAFF 240422]|uniref:Uncharacterized protein n=1 Tax=Colletotrichum orbiculare (strain 104-T / ATCC 96160 / CBS 514.97 / LARS 414 / MAFF 240422) TaxID=1213857 RepID=A0A484FHQ2_COLOR|nr:hypothetical protein Cob_v009458 [Colletotrichum orbiculare MAFF 240422]